MNNKKIPLLALGMLAIGAIGSIAYQSFAQTPSTTPTQPVVIASVVPVVDQNIDQKDVNGKDIETNDDAKSTTGISKESANDNDSDAQSEQNEKGSDQVEAGE